MSQNKKAPQNMEGSSSLKTVQGDKNKSEDTKNSLTTQDIERLKRYQQGRLIIAFSQAKQPLNMRQLAILTGIERPTLCRRISELQESGVVILNHYARCPISKYSKVGFYVKGGSLENGN